MNRRASFLHEFFRGLDTRGIAWCALRSFEAILAGEAADVDLLVEAADLSEVRFLAEAAAGTTGHRLVQTVRFVNHSWVFWDGQAGFTRLDLDTEIRWRACHVLTAGEVLGARRRDGPLWVPSVAHEAMILRTQLAAVAGAPPSYAEKYNRRLAELGEPPGQPHTERRRLLRALGRHPLRALRYLVRDALRWRQRLITPPGVALQVVSLGEFDPQPLQEALRELFPRMGESVRTETRPDRRALFRGRLAITLHRVANPVALGGQPARKMWPAGGARDFSGVLRGAFAALVQPEGKIIAAHYGTGALVECATAVDLAPFMARCLAANFAESRGRGRVVALVGLDGAGKTTFARHLCGLAVERGNHSGVRYFHFLPRGGVFEFPWPALVETPRKKPISGGMQHWLSRARLARTVLRARWGFFTRVRPLRRAGWLVLIDRYVVNYWLDPDSVRYAGGAAWLERARRFLPQPDALIVLTADPATLRARKQELSEAEIAAQSARLATLPRLAPHRLDLDATRPPESLAREALDWLQTLP
jgi:thymidylate kinase